MQLCFLFMWTFWFLYNCFLFL